MTGAPGAAEADPFVGVSIDLRAAVQLLETVVTGRSSEGS